MPEASARTFHQGRLSAFEALVKFLGRRASERWVGFHLRERLSLGWMKTSLVTLLNPIVFSCPGSVVLPEAGPLPRSSASFLCSRSPSASAADPR